MTWNLSLLDGEIPMPILDPVTWETIGFKPGYHMNIPPELVTPAIAAYLVTPPPVTPERVFAGDPDGEGHFVVTAFLRFTDEAQAIEILADYWSLDEF